MFNLHTHIESSDSIINIDSIDNLNLIDGYYYSIGNHPWYVDESITELESLINEHSNIIAIGECGIDKIKSHHPIEKQIEILKTQIQLSEKLKMPLILHIVKGFNEIIKLKKGLNPTQKWVIHGVNNYKQIDTLNHNGFYLSFGKSLLQNRQLQKCFTELPLSKIFLETDSSDVGIENLYTFAASLKEIELKSLILQIRKNLNKITNGKLA